MGTEAESAAVIFQHLQASRYVAAAGLVVCPSIRSRGMTFDDRVDDAIRPYFDTR